VVQVLNMHIILTHEQADFDALASLLGAHLLDDSAVPVLPRKMNRNVRAFLTIYGIELPFIDPRDLPQEPIEAITLVDTQSIVSLRGMSEATRVHVIDHHPLREDLPSDWIITVSGTGANTTVFIEGLQEHDIALSSVQATLLLIGIYEDTGSLTYYHTTSRDLRAASYLLDQGASLQIAADYLNHPLSIGQQELYDLLRANAVYEHVHGQTVIVAIGEAQSMDEELSTVAHKLRDLLDPDALFVLVTTRGGVQMIARSTSDNIDVSVIMARFGGGGHDRAAAGLVKDRKLDDIKAELLRILPDYVHPSISVAQIMSPSPQLLAPDTPVEEAERRMQRYGYEGYPVVSSGKIIGLLTRRAVDRALAHKLNTSAGKLMEAGEYSIGPDDSIDSLQRLMTDTGWGQVPVVQPETGQIIGIVTRTDLIKSLAPQARLPGRQNLAERLESALPPPRLTLLRTVANVAHEQHCALYIVGGFVRDLLLERPSLDFDLVVEGDAITLARTLARKYGGRVTSHTRFGTAKWHLYKAKSGGSNREIPESLQAFLGASTPVDLPQNLDLVSARTEFYTHPTALPTVERGSIKLDLHRRDFTINTLALRLDGYHYGELHDYWGGYADLRHRLVRVLHSLSFVDDPTRILRAVRFEQRFEFRIEKRSLELLEEAIPLLGKISGDRIRHELDHILLEERATKMMLRLDNLGLLAAIHPSLGWDQWLQERIQLLCASEPASEWGISKAEEPVALRRDLSYILWLIRLTLEEAHSVVERLKFSAEFGRTILEAGQLWKDLPDLRNARPSQIARRLGDIPSLALYSVSLAVDDLALKEILFQYKYKWQKMQPGIDGNDLRARGLPPGPSYRVILDKLRDAWLDGEIVSTQEEAAFLDRLIEINTSLD
jgi:tRNA nucleotidyltransferase (CCA-adding enzyme)